MFIQGQEYRRVELHDNFGGQGQSGISPSSKYPIIFLFTGKSGEQFGYDDKWTPDGTLLYTGEGQNGDMAFIRGNLALRDHLINEKDLYLFSYIRKGYVRYVGQMICTGYHLDRGNDHSGNERQVIVFELAPLVSFSGGFINSNENDIRDLGSLSLAELRKRALDCSALIRDAHERKSIYRYRSQAIRLYALHRSNGVCEGCGVLAPFLTESNQPYLEVHHIYRLSDGGPDHPEAVVAICPNCHRRAHHSNDRIEFKQYLLDKVAILERQ